ncbi:MAG: hypothetical protein CVV47_01620 [Spirochaetae bacterium HGW-Spirochaetae-3]|jgi:phosphatidate cytidylyltransferase|nr:MAG: hypothetical protein CVV47_01620 [Spirochaetae bacterium HGW-Spirochaetae-3]
MNNFLTRILFVGIAVPLLFALAVYVPFMNHAALAAIVLLFCAGTSLELVRMVEPDAAAIRSAIAVVLGISPAVAVYVSRLAYPAQGLAASWLAPLACIMIAEFLIAALPLALPRRVDTIETSIRRASANALYLMYPGALGSAIIVILGATDHSGQLLIWFAMIVFGNDSLAWLAGVTLGRNRGIFAVSPNKSLEGLIAGLAGSVACAFAGPFLFPAAVPRDWAALAALGSLCGVAVVIGDLFESAVKRSAGVKDSGTVVPGRGGVLDSFDSLLFAAPVFTGILAIIGILS